MASKNLLILGLKPDIMQHTLDQIDIPGAQVFGGHDVEAARSAFAKAPIDTVILGAALDLETRLAVVRLVFESSDSTTVHMKDFASGAEGFLPFIMAHAG